MISDILMTWRVISSLDTSDMPTDQKMRLSNDARYLAHRLSVYANIDGIPNEIQHLVDWSDLYLKEEIVCISSKLTNY
jgi:hypothetical protein